MDEFNSGLSYALSCLKFGDLKLKDKQREAIKAVYDDKDVFLWLPTGYGKSICYQALPFLFDFKLKRTTLPSRKHNVCVIVSPLISLMVEQVTRLRAIGVGSAILSGNSGVEKSLLATEKDIKLGAFALIFSTPEAIFCSNRWRDISLRNLYVIRLLL